MHPFAMEMVAILAHSLYRFIMPQNGCGGCCYAYAGNILRAYIQVLHLSPHVLMGLSAWPGSLGQQYIALLTNL